MADQKDRQIDIQTPRKTLAERRDFLRLLSGGAITIGLGSIACDNDNPLGPTGAASSTSSTGSSSSPAPSTSSASSSSSSSTAPSSSSSSSSSGGGGGSSSSSS